MSRLLERNVEEAVRREVLKLSTPNRQILFWKLSAIGIRGIPDRIMLWAPGRVLFIEFKKPGSTPRRLQGYIHTIIRSLGFEVEVHDNVLSAIESIKSHLGEAR